MFGLLPVPLGLSPVVSNSMFLRCRGHTRLQYGSVYPVIRGQSTHIQDIVHLPGIPRRPPSSQSIKRFRRVDWAPSYHLFPTHSPFQRHLPSSFRNVTQYDYELEFDLQVSSARPHALHPGAIRISCEEQPGPSCLHVCLRRRRSSRYLICRSVGPHRNGCKARPQAPVQAS